MGNTAQMVQTAVRSPGDYCQALHCGQSFVIPSFQSKVRQWRTIVARMSPNGRHCFFFIFFKKISLTSSVSSIDTINTIPCWATRLIDSDLYIVLLMDVFSSNEHRWPWYEPTTFLFNQYPFHDVHFNNCPGKWMSPQSFEQMSFQAFWLFIYLLFDLLSPPRKDADNLKQEAINDASSRNQWKF